MTTFLPPVETDEESDEPNEPEPCLLVNYVNSELEADGISLSDPVCSRLMAEILDQRATFADALASKSEELEKGGQERFSAQVAELASQELSIPELEQAERRLQSELEDEYASALFDFSASWLSRRLISQEDDELRRLACDMVAEPYTLSRYHRKTGVVQTEAERLPEILPRAINELRAGVVENNIAEIKGTIASDIPAEEKLKAMKRLADLLEIRKALAFYNGERILSNR